MDRGYYRIVAIPPGKLGMDVQIVAPVCDGDGGGGGGAGGGAVVRRISRSCAFRDRISIGDRIATIDGRPVRTTSDLRLNSDRVRRLGVVPANPSKVDGLHALMASAAYLERSLQEGLRESSATMARAKAERETTFDELPTPLASNTSRGRSLRARSCGTADGRSAYTGYTAAPTVAPSAYTGALTEGPSEYSGPPTVAPTRMARSTPSPLTGVDLTQSGGSGASFDGSNSLYTGAPTLAQSQAVYFDMSGKESPSHFDEPHHAPDRAEEKEAEEEPEEVRMRRNVWEKQAVPGAGGKDVASSCGGSRTTTDPFEKAYEANEAREGDDAAGGTTGRRRRASGPPPLLPPLAERGEDRDREAPISPRDAIAPCTPAGKDGEGVRVRGTDCPSIRVRGTDCDDVDDDEDVEEVYNEVDGLSSSARKRRSGGGLRGLAKAYRAPRKSRPPCSSPGSAPATPEGDDARAAPSEGRRGRGPPRFSTPLSTPRKWKVGFVKRSPGDAASPGTPGSRRSRKGPDGSPAAAARSPAGSPRKSPRKKRTSDDGSPRWKEVVDAATLKTYYYRVDTREVTWKRPPELEGAEGGDEVEVGRKSPAKSPALRAAFSKSFDVDIRRNDTGVSALTGLFLAREGAFQKKRGGEEGDGAGDGGDADAEESGDANRGDDGEITVFYMEESAPGNEVLSGEGSEFADQTSVTYTTETGEREVPLAEWLGKLTLDGGDPGATTPGAVLCPIPETPDAVYDNDDPSELPSPLADVIVVTSNESSAEAKEHESSAGTKDTCSAVTPSHQTDNSVGTPSKAGTVTPTVTPSCSSNDKRSHSSNGKRSYSFNGKSAVGRGKTSLRKLKPNKLFFAQKKVEVTLGTPGTDGDEIHHLLPIQIDHLLEEEGEFFEVTYTPGATSQAPPAVSPEISEVKIMETSYKDARDENAATKVSPDTVDLHLPDDLSSDCEPLRLIGKLNFGTTFDTTTRGGTSPAPQARSVASAGGVDRAAKSPCESAPVAPGPVPATIMLDAKEISRIESIATTASESLSDELKADGGSPGDRGSDRVDQADPAGGPDGGDGGETGIECPDVPGEKEADLSSQSLDIQFGRKKKMTSPLKFIKLHKNFSPGASSTGGSAKATSKKKDNGGEAARIRSSGDLSYSGDACRGDENAAAQNAQPWRAILDPSTFKTYYFNSKTKEVSWDKPPGFDDGPAVRFNESEQKESEGNQNNPIKETAPKEGEGKEPGVLKQDVKAAPDTTVDSVAKYWRETHDPTTGKMYYFNRKTKEVSWIKPESCN